MRKTDDNKLQLNIERFFPSTENGLTDKQVLQREQEKLTNKTKKKTTKTYWEIIVSNVLTFFNILLVAIAVLEIVAGNFEGIFAFMTVMLLNMIIGLVQDIRAKKLTEKLNLTTAPMMTVIRNGEKKVISTEKAVLDDIFVLETGNQICVDAEIKSGTIEVDESILTGESLSVKKTIGEKIYSGTFVVSGKAIAQATQVGKYSVIEQIQAKAKQFKRPKSELLRSLNVIFRVISYFILPLGIVLFFVNRWSSGDTNAAIINTSASLIGMIPSGMFLFTSMTLAVGVIRLGRRKTMVQELYSIEMLARSTVLCFDKTGTLTDGTMSVANVKLLDKHKKKDIKFIISNLLSATKDSNQTALALIKEFSLDCSLKPKITLPFSSQRKYSAATFEREGTYIIGALEFILKEIPFEIQEFVDSEARKGYRVLVLTHSRRPIKNDAIPDNSEIIALISIKDNIRANAKQTIQWFKENNVNIKIISGDNPITVSEIARQCGVDNFDSIVNLEDKTDDEVRELALTKTIFGRVSPEQKSIIVEALKDNGETVAMTGDGVNDIIALKCADCSIAMASGAEATQYSSHLVLIDSDFSHMPEVVQEGRRVVNNLQQTCSLFLTKTIFAFLVSLVFLIASLAAGSKSQIHYPFETQHLYIWEFCGIGIASFFLSLQPNDRIIKGDFINNVVSDAIPGGLSIALAVLFIFMLRANSEVTGVNTTEIAVTMSMLTMSIMCLIVLLRCCLPFNKYRACVYSALIAFTVGIFVVLNTIKIFINGERLNIFQIHLDMLTSKTILITVGIVVVFSAIYFLLSYVFKNYITLKKRGSKK